MEDDQFEIQYVARRTGLSPHRIRAWERRYGVVAPVRARNNRRLYSESDIDRLTLLRHAVDAGHRIAAAAAMSDEALIRLAGAPNRMRDSRREEKSAAFQQSLTEAFAQAWSAVNEMDAAGLRQCLDRAAVTYTRPRLVHDLIRPLFVHIGDEWRGGRLKIANEHLASAVVRSFLLEQLSAVPPPIGAPGIVVTTPSGHWHEIGALVAGWVATDAGWHVHYLGPNLPPEEIASAALQLNASAVALSLTYSADPEATRRELIRLSALLPPGGAILAGGATVFGESGVTGADAIRWCEDTDALTDHLTRLSRAAI